MTIEKRIELTEKTFNTIKELCNTFDAEECSKFCPFNYGGSTGGGCIFTNHPIRKCPNAWNISIKTSVNVDL